MKGNSKSELIISKLGGRRNLRNHGVRNITCNNDGSVILIFEGYRRVTIKQMDSNNFMLIRPSSVEGDGVHLNLTMYEMLDIISNSCNISLWLIENKSKGQLFSESIIEILGGLENLKSNFGIRDLIYFTGKEQLDFFVKESIGNNTKIRIYSNYNKIIIEKRRDLNGYFNIDTKEIEDISELNKALEELIGFGNTKKRNVLIRNRI